MGEYALFVFAVPIPTSALTVFGSSIELLGCQVGTIAAEPSVVSQDRPRNWIVIFADSEKSTKAKDREGDLTAYLFDHHTLDLANLLLVSAIDGRALYLIAADQ